MFSRRSSRAALPGEPCGCLEVSDLRPSVCCGVGSSAVGRTVELMTATPSTVRRPLPTFAPLRHACCPTLERHERQRGQVSKPLLVCRESDDAIEPKFSVFCAGYEQSRWRAKELVRDFFRRHLNSFALSYSEWKKVDGDSAAAALARSAKMVYATDNYQRRGEFGELFLHGILRDFYGAEPAVSKIYFLDTPNDTAKGFDAVHVVVNEDGELDLWLGEAKLYISMNSAIKAVVTSLQEHIGNDFLRKEFLAVSNKFDDGWQHSEKLRDLLDGTTPPLM